MTSASVSTDEIFGALSRDKTELIKLLLEKEQDQTQTIKPYPRDESSGSFLLSASWAQQRLWFIDQLEAGSAAYCISLEIRLQGPLHRDALQRALDTLVQRHEALRTVFVNDGGEPKQKILTEGRFTLRMIDLSDCPETDQQAQIRLHANEEAHGRFDLHAGPLIRGRLLRVANEDHVLLIAMHHIVSDGWSLGVFTREIAELYATYLEGRNNSLSPLPIQYADYAQWQRQYLRGDMLDDQLNYWRARLERAAPQLDLPTDRPRPAVQSYRGSNIAFSLGAQLSMGVRAFARRYEMTPVMVLYAAWAILLSKISGQRDVVVGMPIANRQRRELEGLIGFFVNTLVLRVEVRNDLAINSFLHHVKDVMLGAYEHQDVPFEKLVEALQPERSLSRNPLFQVMFSVEDVSNRDMRLPGLIATHNYVVSEYAKFDLTLALEERGSEFVGNLTYATDLFGRQTMDRWAARFIVVLRGMVDEVHSRIGDLPILPEGERHQVVELFNSTQAAYPREKLIHELFEEQVRRTPQAAAVVYEGQSLTYAELNSRANQLAWYLKDEGAVIGDCIPVLMPRSIRMVIAQLAVLKSGCTYLPIDPEIPVERRDFMIRDCGGRILITENGHGGAISELVRVIDGTCIDELAGRGSAKNLKLNLKGAVSPAAYVMYTSGSTGVPKGVVVPHYAVNRLVINNGYAEVHHDDCIAHYSNPAFDASTFEIWGALLNGARVLIVPQEIVLDSGKFAEEIKKRHVTVLWMSVGLFNQYADAFAGVFPQLRCLIVGGDALNPETVRRVLHRGGPQLLLNGYGPTECTTFSTTYLIKEVEEGAQGIPIGLPIANAQVYILDSQRQQPVPIGVTGELYIGGAGVARGYLNRPELTAERFVADPFSVDPQGRLYKTGDLGRWRSDGTIEYLGRNDHQVKIRGFRIELGEIEAQLHQHPLRK